MAEYANVIVDISLEKLDKTFQYRIPEHLKERLQVGMQVELPFGKGNRSMTGYVTGLTDEPEFDVAKMKELYGISEKGIPAEAQLIQLAAWMREQYGSTMNQAIKTVLPIKKTVQEKQRKFLVLLVSREEAEKQLAFFEAKHQLARARVLRGLLKENPMSYERAREVYQATPPVLKKLTELGLLQIQAETVYRNPIDRERCGAERVLLSADQRQAVEGIWQSAQQEGHSVSLLYGVTGSGKTEVYMELISRVLAEGKEAIMLIPEIALTYQTVSRFYERFGEKVSMINSRLSQGERFDQFERARQGEIQVMIGPRSALFTPFQRLGMILIDEEHETSYKSENVPKYHAREAAIYRASLTGAAVVLGSATPSVDSWYQAKKGNYHLWELKNRILEKPMATVYTVDLREELREGNRSIISRRLREGMKERLKKGEQILLFLNRRGYAGFLSCRACGHVIKCPHCDVSMALHGNGSMVCHYCGYKEPAARVCPACGSKYIAGFRAGTQQMEELVKREFPNARVLRMDLDTTKGKDGHEQILAAFGRGEADILIGTQMIVKGHDFPNVTLVGVLAADLSLYSGDYLAAERTFQLLTQAVGRAGRGEKRGEAVIQTYSPDHYSIQTAAAQDYESFYEQEMAYRSLMGYPPAAFLYAVLLTSEDEAELALRAQEIGAFLKKEAAAFQVVVIGPADASIARIKDVYRKVIYLKQTDARRLLEVKRRLEKEMEHQLQWKNINIQLDRNPVYGY